MKLDNEPRTSIERKVFGQHPTIELPVDSFVRLPQVRSGLNPELGNLVDSIRTRGLINQVDVACMSSVQLNEYITFVNQLWGTDVTLDDYASQQQTDGTYYVVVAGHTRTEAVHQLQQEANEQGGEFEYVMVAKVHEIDNPEEIISLQLDENIHSKPAQEQRAIAIVETYHYGLQNGSWKDKADFLRQSRGKFSRQILNEAIGFAQLPPDARDFVFSRRLSYNAAVALGLSTDTILDYAAARLGYIDEVPESNELFEAAYREEIGLMIIHISNKRLNGTAAKKYIAGQVAMMQKHLQDVRGEDSGTALFDMSMISVQQQQETYMQQLKVAYNAALRAMKELSIGSVTDALVLHRQLVGDEGIEELADEHARRCSVLGVSAMRSATSDSSATSELAQSEIPVEKFPQL